MKSIALIITSLAATATFLVLPIVSLLPSCTLTPAQRTSVMSFTELGVKTAVESGALKPGYSVLITAGVGLVTSLAPDAKPKAVPLEKLGLTEALQSGKIEQGDKLVIGTESAVVVHPATSVPTPVLGERQDVTATK
jgi:hypothetical protein